MTAGFDAAQAAYETPPDDQLDVDEEADAWDAHEANLEARAEAAEDSARDDAADRADAIAHSHE